MLFKRKIKERVVSVNTAIRCKLKVGDRFTTKYNGKYTYSNTISSKHYMNTDIVNICIAKNTILSIPGVSTINAERKGNTYLNYKGIIKLFEKYLRTECPLTYERGSIKILDSKTLSENKYLQIKKKYLDKFCVLVDYSFYSNMRDVNHDFYIVGEGNVKKADRNKPCLIAVVWKIDTDKWRKRKCLTIKIQ